MDYSTAVKTDEPRYTHEQKMNLKNIMVRERNKLQNDPYTMIPLLSSWKQEEWNYVYICDKCKEEQKND